MFLLAPVVAYLTLLYTPAWAAMCPDGNGMSDDVRRTFVDKHNEYRDPSRTRTLNCTRSLVAEGKAANPKYGGFAPKAARMFKVSYDCNVERSMMAWIQKCPWGHSPESARQGLGENLWMVIRRDDDERGSAINATAAWFDELRRTGVPVNNVLTVDVSKKTVHYTQLVWQRSDRIGCAVKLCPRVTYAGCQYKEAGNLLNTYIYETGNPCTRDSDCQCNNCTCSAAEALCIRPDSTPMPAPKFVN